MDADPVRPPVVFLAFRVVAVLAVDFASWLADDRGVMRPVDADDGVVPMVGGGDGKAVVRVQQVLVEGFDRVAPDNAVVIGGIAAGKKTRTGFEMERLLLFDTICVEAFSLGSLS